MGLESNSSAGLQAALECHTTPLALPFVGFIHFGQKCMFAWHLTQSGLEQMRLLQIALHSAIRSTIIFAILFAIQTLMALATQLQSNTLPIALSTHSTR